MKVINKESNEIQKIIALKTNRNKRHKYKEFVVEGRIALNEVCKKNWRIKSLFYNKDQAHSLWAQQYIDSAQCENRYAVSNQIMEKITDKTDPSELITVVKQPHRSFDSYEPSSGDVIVVLDEPKSPGNLGMMIRSAAAFQASALLISGHGADEYDPQCIRASVGTFFTLPIYRVDGIRHFAEKIDALKNKFSISIIASGDKGTSSLEQGNFQAEIVYLILGNETVGVSAGYQQIADQFIHIPLHGEFTSLNIAAAGSILLYEIFRKRSNF